MRTVADREQVVRGEQTERGQWDRDTDDRAEHHVGEMVDAEVDPKRADDRDRTRDGDLRPEPWPAGRDERKRNPYRKDRDGSDRDRRRGIALPARELLDAEGPRPQGQQLESLQERSGDAEGDHPDDELAPAPEPRRREHEEHTERREPDPEPMVCAFCAIVSSHAVRIETKASVINASNRSSGPASA